MTRSQQFSLTNARSSGTAQKVTITADELAVRIVDAPLRIRFGSTGELATIVGPDVFRSKKCGTAIGDIFIENDAAGVGDIVELFWSDEVSAGKADAVDEAAPRLIMALGLDKTGALKAIIGSGAGSTGLVGATHATKNFYAMKCPTAVGVGNSLQFNQPNVPISALFNPTVSGLNLLAMEGREWRMRLETVADLGAVGAVIFLGYGSFFGTATAIYPGFGLWCDAGVDVNWQFGYRESVLGFLFPKIDTGIPVTTHCHFDLRVGMRGGVPYFEIWNWGVCVYRYTGVWGAGATTFASTFDAFYRGSGAVGSSLWSNIAYDIEMLEVGP